MKTNIIVILLLALAFTVDAQERVANEKGYEFRYEPAQSGSRVVWYQELDLYIDGVYAETFNIGNSPDVLIMWGFRVPLRSNWELRLVKTVATLNGSPLAIQVYYPTRGYADNSQHEYIVVERER